MLLDASSICLKSAQTPLPWPTLQEEVAKRAARAARYGIKPTAPPTAAAAGGPGTALLDGDHAPPPAAVAAAAVPGGPTTADAMEVAQYLGEVTRKAERAKKFGVEYDPSEEVLLKKEGEPVGRVASTRIYKHNQSLAMKFWDIAHSLDNLLQGDAQLIHRIDTSLLHNVLWKLL